MKKPRQRIERGYAPGNLQPPKEQKLEIGKNYLFQRINKDGEVTKTKTTDDEFGTKLNFQGRVLQEYPNYYLIQERKYKCGMPKGCIGVDWSARKK